MRRHERDAQARHHCLLDRLGVAQLHRGSDSGADVLQRSLGGLTTRRPLLPDEQPFCAEQVGGDLAAAAPTMPRRHDEHQLIAHSLGQALLPGTRFVSADHAEIELVRADLFLDMRGIGDPHTQGDPGISLLEPSGELRENVDPGRCAGADQQRSALQSRELGDRFTRARQGRKDATGVVLEDSPRLGESDSPAEPIEESVDETG